MKFIVSRECQVVTDALNFSTADCHITGACDLYTTKAAGSDKKLYKNIESTLESQHESLVRISASLSPPQRPVDGRAKSKTPSTALPEVDLSRDSPFGPLSQISARRTFAYLIATLNASHPDYDFSNTLKPADFQRTTGTAIRKSVDSTMLYLRPRRMLSAFAPKKVLSSSAPNIPSAEITWSEQMWDLIDREMDLRHCDKYIWEPENDPFEDESSLWSNHFFFFNKDKKRVCYLHFGAFSVISHSPLSALRPIRARSVPRQNVSIADGAGKRARYWLGHSVDDNDVDSSWREDDDLYEGEYTDDLDDIREHIGDGHYTYDQDSDGYVVDHDPPSWQGPDLDRMRSQSVDMAEAMEL